ncbi:MAG TPA: class F sortase [Acidimicrobiia bacterium]|nr:class F sortase [Acidimicrobiia bacterium]
MGAARHRFLAVAGVVLAASGATAIVWAVTAQTPPHPPQWAGSEELAPEVSAVESDPAPPPGEGHSLRPPTPFSPVPEEVDDPVLLQSSEPTAIDIPAIGVHSEMQQVGLTVEHTMEVPAPGPYYDQAAWYKHSATPGALGPAIIVGHVDSAANGPSVFFDLGSLRPGDEVLVTRRDGTVAVFTVEAVRQYSKDDFPTDLVYGDTDHAALRLITCGGPFNRAQRSYLDNVVVFASLVGSHQASPAS